MLYKIQNEVNDQRYAGETAWLDREGSYRIDCQNLDSLCCKLTISYTLSIIQL